MSDKYDEAVEYLTEHPDEIFDAWNLASLDKKGSILFQHCAPGRYGIAYGCLTQVRFNGYLAFTEELTTAIRADNRIPSGGHCIEAHHLPVFAEWRRKLDAAFEDLEHAQV